MGLSPIIMGATRPSWVATVLKTDNSALDLTGATFTGVLYEQNTGNRKTLTPGNYSLTNATGGVFTYAPIAGDVDTPGLWTWETAITIGGQVYYVSQPSIRIVPRYAP